MSIAERLKQARAALRLKQEEMVAISGIPLDTYRKYEGGKSEPGARALAGLAKAGVDLNWLITGVRYSTDENGKQYFDASHLYSFPTQTSLEPGKQESPVTRSKAPASPDTPPPAINVKALEAIIEGAFRIAPNGSPAKLAAHCAGIYGRAIEEGLITPTGIGGGNLDDAA